MVALSCTAAFMHELGHIITMSILNTKTNNIKLSVFDININDDFKFKRTLPKELIVILSGIIVNIVLCLISYKVYKATNISAFYSFYMVNMALAFFNILPVDSLDGGNAVFIILLKFFSFEKSEKYLDIISFVFLLPLAIIGFIILLESKYNFTLLFTSCYLMGIILLKKSKILRRLK